MTNYQALITALSLVLVVVPTFAGASAAQERTQVFRSDTELATITATVTDRSGRAVTTLRRDDFAVFENNVRQELAFFSLDDETPISVVIVVDTSGSMVDKIEDVEDALDHFIARLKDEDEVSLLRFSDSVERVATGTGADRDRLGRAIRRLTARGGTALYDAVQEGVRTALAGSHRKKVVLLVTDGNDTSSAASRRDVVREIQRAEVLVYALGIGHGGRGSFGHGTFNPFGHGGAAQDDTVDAGTLRALAEPSGGRSWLLEAPHRGGVDLVDQAIQEMAAELRQQYTLAYYPAANAGASGPRPVRVETKDSQYKVRARSSLGSGAARK